MAASVYRNKGHISTPKKALSYPPKLDPLNLTSEVGCKAVDHFTEQSMLIQFTHFFSINPEEFFVLVLSTP